MPPGIKEVGSRRVLCPQDRRHGGTWIGVNDRGLAASVTNFHGSGDPDALSRGLVCLDALGASEPYEAVERVEETLARAESRPFQMLLANDRDACYLQYREGRLDQRVVHEGTVVLSSELPPERMQVLGLEKWASLASERRGDIDSDIDHLVVAMATGSGRDRETGKEFPICKRQGPWQTVSGTILAVPDRLRLASDPSALRISYAAGNPAETPFRDYSGLATWLVD